MISNKYYKGKSQVVTLMGDHPVLKRFDVKVKDEKNQHNIFNHKNVIPHFRDLVNNGYENIIIKCDSYYLKMTYQERIFNIEIPHHISVTRTNLGDGWGDTKISYPSKLANFEMLDEIIVLLQSSSKIAKFFDGKYGIEN